VPSRRPTAAITLAVGLAVIAAGATGLTLTRHSTPALRPVAVGVSALPTPTQPIVAAPQPSQPGQVARPVLLEIPEISVKTQLITLGLANDGSMQVPSSSQVAGWFTGSPRPGAIGSSVIVGHVDSHQGAGVFWRLPTLRPGNPVFVQRADGTLVKFQVTDVRTYPKNHFPTQDVYGGTPDAELRLITCGGAFDPATGHYVSNIVVYATQVT
jgi:sortase (surface protein transpeptidase)